MDPGNWPRIWKLGGMAFPGHSARPTEYVKEWQKLPAREPTPYYFGWGYGADLGGLSTSPTPARPAARVTYPFKRSTAAVTFDRQQTGERDLRLREGGRRPLRPLRRLVRRVRKLGGQQLVDDMLERRRGLPGDVGAVGRGSLHHAASAGAPACAAAASARSASA